MWMQNTVRTYLGGRPERRGRHIALENLQVHHKIKRSQLGNDTLANLVTLCAYCHMGEHGQLGYEKSAPEIMERAVKRGRRLHGSSL
jgi:hypothetical protein